MKKLIIISILSTFSISVFSQDQGQIRAFSNAAFGKNQAVNDDGFKTGIGLNGGLEYFVVDNISINPSVNYYFKTRGNSLIFGQGSKNWWLNSYYLNLDGKYYFDLGVTDLQTYGLFGFTRLYSKYIVQGTTASPATTKFGANFGAGAVLMTSDFWHVMGEFRYSTPSGDIGTPSGGSTIISIGLLYTFD
ncbi:MAG: outer membrane beta-barrel protein [Ekhidna sp.]